MQKKVFLWYALYLTIFCRNLIDCFSGIKTGRYTYEKRTQDVLELQKCSPQHRAEGEEGVKVEREGGRVELDQAIDEFVCRLVQEKEKLLSDVQLVDKSGSGRC